MFTNSEYFCISIVYLFQIVIAAFTNDAWKVRNARSVLERQRRDTPVSYPMLSAKKNIWKENYIQLIKIIFD